MTARPPDSPLVDRFVPSPNFGERRGYGQPNCLILHYTGMPTGEAALKALTDPACEVRRIIWSGKTAPSTNWWRSATGPGMRAKSSWKGETDLNSASIGIEIVNPGHDGGSPPFPDRQIEATIALLRDIARAGRSRPSGFSPIPTSLRRASAIREKLFPGRTLWRSGVGHWTEPAPLAGSPLFAHEEEGPPVRAVQAMLALYGYGVEITGIYDRQTRQVVAAFQRHFRPERVDGEADASTMATLKALIDGLTRASNRRGSLRTPPARACALLQRGRERFEVGKAVRRGDAALYACGGLGGIERAGGRQAHELRRVGVKPVRVDEDFSLFGRDQARAACLFHDLSGRDVEHRGMLDARRRAADTGR